MLGAKFFSKMKMNYYTPNSFPFYDLIFIDIFNSLDLAFCEFCKIGYVARDIDSFKLKLFYDKYYWRWMNRNLGKNSQITHSASREIRHFNMVEQLKFETIVDVGGGGTIFLDLFYSSKKILIEPAKLRINDDIEVYSSLEKVAVTYSNALFRCSHVLEHVINLDKFISDLLRVAGRNTSFLIEVPNIDSKNKFMSELHSPHTFMFSEFALKQLLLKHKLTVVRSDITDEYIAFVLRN